MTIRKRLVAAGLLASMMGCTTLRPVADFEEYVRTARPSQLWITPQDAPPLKLEGPRFVSDTLVGFVGGQYREFAPGSLRMVQVRQPAGGRTAVLVGVAAAVGVALIAVLASSGTSTNQPTPEDPPTTSIPLP